MRAGVLAAALFALLAGPTALAFFSGGHFDESRAWTGLGAWVLVLAAFLADPRALPRGREAWLAFGGLALLGGWTVRSMTWAPIRGNAYHAGQIVFLYVGALLAGATLLGELRGAAEGQPQGDQARGQWREGRPRPDHQRRVERPGPHVQDPRCPRRV